MRKTRLRDVVIGVAIAVVTLEATSLVVVFALGQSLPKIWQRRRGVGYGEDPTGLRITAGRALHDPIVPHPFVGYVYGTLVGPQRHGFFGDDIMKYGGPENYNVVIIGGSVAANFWGDVHELLADRLSRYRKTRGKKVNVFSFAVGGWHQPQQAMSVAYFLSVGAKIDLVLNIDGLNEAFIQIAQAQSSYSIYYPRDWPLLSDTMADVDRGATMGWLQLARRGRISGAQATETPPLRYSATVSLLWYLSDRAAEKGTWMLVRKLQTSKGFAPYQVGYFRPMSEPEVFEQVALVWARSSKLLFDLQRAGRGKYLHVLQPHPYVPNSKPLTAAEIAVTYRPDNQFARWARDGYRYLAGKKAFLEGSGVPFLDATMVFKDVREDLYRDCCHFTKRGNEILMAEMLRSAERAGLFAAN